MFIPLRVNIGLSVMRPITALWRNIVDLRWDKYRLFHATTHTSSKYILLVKSETIWDVGQTRPFRILTHVARANDSSKWLNNTSAGKLTRTGVIWADRVINYADISIRHANYFATVQTQGCSFRSQLEIRGQGCLTLFSTRLKGGGGGGGGGWIIPFRLKL